MMTRAAVLLLAALVVPLAGANAAPGPTCFGKVPTKKKGKLLVGGDEVNRFSGTDRNDVIIGGGGADKLNGGKGNDRICGDGGDGVASLNGDDDTIDGGLGADKIDGQEGFDVLEGGPNNFIDEIHTGDLDPSGSDDVDAASRLNLAKAGPGDDKIFGSNANDRILGGPGADLIEGGDAGDELDGGDESGNGDTIHGQGGADEVKGGAGEDTIFGDAHGATGFADRLFGGPGRDRVEGEAGDDEIHGGDEPADGDFSLSGGPGVDHIFGDAGADVMNGREENDVLFGGADSDVISGDAGIDLCEAGDSAADPSGPAGFKDECEADLSVTGTGPSEANSDQPIRDEFTISNHGPSSARYELDISAPAGDPTNCVVDREVIEGHLLSGEVEIVPITMTCHLAPAPGTTRTVPLFSSVKPGDPDDELIDQEPANNTAAIRTAIRAPDSALGPEDFNVQPEAPVCADARSISSCPDDAGATGRVRLGNSSNITRGAGARVARGVKVTLGITSITDPFGEGSSATCDGPSPSRLDFGDLAPTGQSLTMTYSLLCHVESGNPALQGLVDVCLAFSFSAADGSQVVAENPIELCHSWFDVDFVQGSGPAKVIYKRRAVFRFHAANPKARMQCRLDHNRYGPCSSPWHVKGLELGKHTFRARGVDPGGRLEHERAIWRFTVLP